MKTTDELSVFDSELRQAGPEARPKPPPATGVIAPPPRPRMDAPLSLAELQGRSVALEWFEAVAISQAVSERLCDGRHEGAPVGVKREDVLIDAAGGVSVTSVTAVTDTTTVQQAADLLRSLLPASEVPTNLRLTLLQASSTTSLVEWTRLVEYYERPNRSALIQGVFQRARNAARALPVPQTSQPATPSPMWPPVEAPMAPASASRPPSRFRVRTILAASAALFVVATLAAIGVWMLPESSSGEPPALESSLLPPSPEGAIAAVTSTIAKVVRRLPVAAGADRREGPPAVVSEPSGHTESAPLGSWRLDAPVGKLPTANLPSLPTGSIYSMADTDVVPPVAIYPQFPSSRPPGVGPDQVAEFDIIINEEGRVDSVKALRVPSTMGEAVRVTMTLSAAKAWRFSPGLKDGEPVKYRKVVWVLKP